MRTSQIVQLYSNQGLENCKLTKSEDILNIHGVNVYETSGYKYLKSEHKELFKKFIINFFNAWGLETRSTLYPLAVNYVKETEYLGKEKPCDDYYIVLGGKVEALRENNIELLREWKDDNYNLECIEQEEREYLRFEYEVDNKKEWQHIINEKEWY